MIQNTIEAHHKRTPREAKKAVLSSMYGAVEDIVRQPVNHGAPDSTISSRSDRFTESQQFAQNVIGCVMRISTFTVTITKPIRRNA